ncbi:MAG TPA: energy transducer TonB [Gemmatimonadaceae bacterium]|nr:energy transducer TonB [Gemmatimonadaceae bacterium]
MLRTLIESRAGRTRRPGGTLVSITLHTALIATAVAVTARATPAPPPAPIVEPVIYTAPVPRQPAPAAPAAPARPSSLTVPRIPVPVIAPVAVPTHLPPIDPRALVGDSAWFDLKPGPVAAPTGDGRATAAGAADGVYDARQVDRAVMPVDGNPAPRYPERLRSAHVEGWVTVRFIVDTTGRAEPGSVEVLSATHPLFADAVRDALREARYRPAEAGGRRVRQLVEQRFGFTLRR